jgi:hypothetical protein
MSKTYLKSDHFNGGGSLEVTSIASNGMATLVRYTIKIVSAASRKRPDVGEKNSWPAWVFEQPYERHVHTVSGHPLPGVSVHGSCPSGWSYSPTSKMCVESGC